MQYLVLATVILSCLVQCSLQQPPGIPPKGSQVPVQQQQQQQPNVNAQQNDQQGGHRQRQGLQFSSEVHNADHILEHLQNVIATKSKDQMTEEELEFHYFKLHDYDNNNKLDGVEIGKALTHFHDEGSESNEHGKVFPDNEIANIVDSVMTENDENRDGYIEYFEFKRRQGTVDNTQQQDQQQQPQP